MEGYDVPRILNAASSRHRQHPPPEYLNVGRTAEMELKSLAIQKQAEEEAKARERERREEEYTLRQVETASDQSTSSPTGRILKTILVASVVLSLVLSLVGIGLGVVNTHKLYGSGGGCSEAVETCVKNTSTCEIRGEEECSVSLKSQDPTVRIYACQAYHSQHKV